MPNFFSFNQIIVLFCCTDLRVSETKVRTVANEGLRITQFTHTDSHVVNREDGNWVMGEDGLRLFNWFHSSLTVFNIINK